VVSRCARAGARRGAPTAIGRRRSRRSRRSRRPIPRPAPTSTSIIPRSSSPTTTRSHRAGRKRSSGATSSTRQAGSSGLVLRDRDGSQYGSDLIGWGNDELQWYLPDSAQLNDGKLKITVRRETAGGYNYTSAASTRATFRVRYGRIEASIKLPPGRASAGVLATGAGQPYGRWQPAARSTSSKRDLDGTAATRSSDHSLRRRVPANLSSTARYQPSTDVTAGFHTYALEWDPTRSAGTSTTRCMRCRTRGHRPRPRSRRLSTSPSTSSSTSRSAADCPGRRVAPPATGDHGSRLGKSVFG